MFSFVEKTKKIILTRGDTAQIGFDFTVTVGDSVVSDYKAVFHLKQKTGVRYPLLASTELVDGVLTITHEMTQGLESGPYWYDIEITAGDQVMTYGPYQLQLEPDVG